MAIVPEQAKYNVRLIWLAGLQGLYTFPPIQRVLLVAGILLIIPGYWFTRIGAKVYYNWAYSKQLVVAHPSFANPQNVLVDETKVFPLNSGQFIAFAKIKNPNLDLAGFNVPYTFSVRNNQNEEVYTQTGSTYILPGSEQYIMTPAFSGASGASKATANFGTIHWQKRFQIPDVKLATPAAGFTDSVAGLRIDGSVINDSAYTLGTVQLTFLIYDRAGALIGAIQRNEGEVRSKSRRSFPQVWPGLIQASDVFRIVAIASTNVLDSRNLRAGVTIQGISPFIESEDER